MKNMVVKILSSRLMLVSFVLAALFLVAPDSVQAQSNTNEASHYVSPAVAIERLELEASVLKGQIELLVPGTAAYRIALWKYDLYDAVLNYLYEGKSVDFSANMGLKIYAADPYNDMPASLKKANRTELFLIVHL